MRFWVSKTVLNHTMPIKLSNYTQLTVGIACLGAGLRLIGLDKGIWLDEYYAIEIARSNNLIQSLEQHDYMPSYFLILRLWSSLSTAEPFLRMLSVVWGVLTILVVMYWLKPRSHSASLLAGLMCATAPALLRYSQEIQTYSLLIFAVALSFYCADQISKQGASGWWYFALAASLVVTVTTHMVGIMAVASICVYLLPNVLAELNGLTRVKSRPKDSSRISQDVSATNWWNNPVITPRFVAAISLPVIVFAIAYYFLGSDGKESGWWMPPISAELVTTQFKLVFGIQALLAPSDLLSRYGSELPALYSITIYLMLFALLVCLVMGNWRRSWNFMVAGATYWGQILLFSLIFLPIFWYRTLLPGIIPWIGFVALQAVTIPKRRMRRVAVGGISMISLAFVAGWGLAGAWMTHEPIKQAAQWLEAEYQPGDCVVFYPDYTLGPVRYYFPTLPPESSVAVPLGADVNRSAIEMEKCLVENAHPKHLFLVFREDLNFEKDKKTYADLLAYLKALSIEIYPRQDFGLLSITQYEMR